MEGDPVHRRDDPPESGDAEFAVAEPGPARHPDTIPVTILALACGLTAALTAIVRSGVLSAQEGADPAWLLSALGIAIVAGCWLAGIIHLLLFLLPGRSRRHPGTSWAASLAAFAVGPLLVALFFFGAGLASFPVSGLAFYPVAAVILLVLLFARRSIRLLAERLLVSFFLWLFILVAPTFWRDPVNEQMSSFLFGLLKAAGFLT